LIYFHVLVANISETISDEVLHRHYGPDVVVAEVKHSRAKIEDNDESQPTTTSREWKMSDVAVSEKLEKFVEDVK